MTRPGFQLRPAGSHDSDVAFGLFTEVQAIHADAHPGVFRLPEKDETFEGYFDGILGDPDQHLVFACVNETAVGYIAYFLGLRPESVFQPERRVAHIHSLVVAEAHRRSGCASLLIDHVKQEARRHDITQLEIDVWSFNDAARACFEKAGFTVCKESLWLGP